jgi:hypothetical protein
MADREEKQRLSLERAMHDLAVTNDKLRRYTSSQSINQSIDQSISQPVRQKSLVDESVFRLVCGL